MHKIVAIKGIIYIYGRKCAIFTSHYVHNPTKVAVSVFSSTGQLGRVSIHTEHLLDPGEFVVSHDMPLEILFQLRESMHFEDTGKRVNYGYIQDQPVWKLVGGRDEPCPLRLVTLGNGEED